MRFILNAPPSANVMYRNVQGKTLKSKQYRAWLDASRGTISEVLYKTPGYALEDKARFRVHIDYYPKDKRQRDIDNLLKPCCDALEGLVYANDNQVDHLSISRRRANASLEMAIIEVFAEGLGTRA